MTAENPNRGIELESSVESAVDRARDAAQRWQHPRISSAHLLYGLVSSPDTLTEVEELIDKSRIEGLGIEGIYDTPAVDIAHHARLLEDKLVEKNRAEHGREVSFTGVAERFLNTARERAKIEGLGRVTTQNLLVGILEAGGYGSAILSSYGVD